MEEIFNDPSTFFLILPKDIKEYLKPYIIMSYLDNILQILKNQLIPLRQKNDRWLLYSNKLNRVNERMCYISKTINLTNIINGNDDPNIERLSKKYIELEEDLNKILLEKEKLSLERDQILLKLNELERKEEPLKELEKLLHRMYLYLPTNYKTINENNINNCSNDVKNALIIQRYTDDLSIKDLDDILKIDKILQEIYRNYN